MSFENVNPWQHYLTEVLGLRAVVWPKSIPALEAEELLDKPKQIKLIIASYAESAADYELLEKILMATKLESPAVLILDTLEQVKNHSEWKNQTVFVFGEEIAVDKIENGIFVFPKLSQIRVNDSLKRPVWEKIKIALQKIV